MSYSVDQEACTGCGTCVEVCPAEAIETDGGVATIDESICILCGACQVSCPESAVLYDGKPCRSDIVPLDTGSRDVPAGS